MLENKLTPTEAANLMVVEAEKNLGVCRLHLEELRTELMSLRKNSRLRPALLVRIDDQNRRIESAENKLAKALEILPVADKMYDLTKQIAEICDQRRKLTPKVANAEVYLLATMRNGFV